VPSGGKYIGVFLPVDTLEVVDVQNPFLPVSRGSIETLESSRRIGVAGSLASVVGEQGLQVVDVAETAAPVARGILDTSWTVPTGIQAADNWVYMINEDGHVQIVDASDATSPVVGYVHGTLQASGLFATRSRLYVTGVEGLAVLDTSDPGAPVLLGSDPAGGSDVHVVRDLAFVTSGGLRILDASDPAQPDLVGTYASARPLDSLYVANGLACLYPRGLGSSSESVVEIVDVSIPSSPTLVATARVPNPDSLAAPYIGGVYIEGNLIYIAAGDDGLWIMEYTAPRLAVARARPVWQQY
jgi:hypothetical protein